MATDERRTDRELSDMIHSLLNHGEAGYTYVKIDAHLSALRELQSLRAQGGVRAAAERLLAHWDKNDGPEKRGEFEGGEYWSPAGRMVDTEFIAALRTSLEASPAPVSEEMVEASCPGCQGTGDQGGNPSYGVCDDCNGTGKVNQPLPAALAAKGGL